MSKYFFGLIAVIFVLGFWGLFFLVIPKHGTVVYDCRLAEISPDFPPDVRNECRKKNSGRI
jgi:hypothetical protein